MPYQNTYEAILLPYKEKFSQITLALFHFTSRILTKSKFNKKIKIFVNKTSKTFKGFKL